MLQTHNAIVHLSVIVEFKSRIFDAPDPMMSVSVCGVGKNMDGGYTPSLLDLGHIFDVFSLAFFLFYENFHSTMQKTLR